MRENTLISTVLSVWIRPAWSSLEQGKKLQHFLFFLLCVLNRFRWVGRTPLPKFLSSTPPGPDYEDDDSSKWTVLFPLTQTSLGIQYHFLEATIHQATLFVLLAANNKANTQPNNWGSFKTIRFSDALIAYHSALITQLPSSNFDFNFRYLVHMMC